MLRSVFALAILAALALPAADLVVPPGLEPRFQAPPGLHWGSFQNADAARLRYCSALPGSPTRVTVVLVGGYTEFAEKYFETMRDLLGQGYAVWWMDWRGQGGSDRYLPEHDKAHSLGLDRDARDLDQFVRTVVKPEPGQPLVLIAHSMGGNIAVRHLHDYPGRFQLAILSAPGLSIGSGVRQGMPDWLIKLVVGTACTFGGCESWAKGAGPWHDRPGFQLSHDPVRAEIQRMWFRANPSLRLGGSSNGWVREYLRSGEIDREPSYLKSIRTPVLMGVASQDVWARPEDQVAACLALPECQIVGLRGAWHELFMESPEFRNPWMQALSQRMEKLLARTR